MPKLPKLTHALADQEIADIMAELEGQASPGASSAKKATDGQKALQRILNRGAQNQAAPGGQGGV